MDIKLNLDVVLQMTLHLSYSEIPDTIYQNQILQTPDLLRYLQLIGTFEIHKKLWYCFYIRKIAKIVEMESLKGFLAGIKPDTTGKE